MLQTLSVQKNIVGVKVLGEHHLPDKQLAISFFETVKLCRQPLNSGAYRVFHARRNNEMIQGLILKHIFGCKIKLLFTSTAQRYHSKFTKWLMGKMDSVISTCQAAASYLSFTPDKIIPHGINTSIYHPANDKQELWYELGLPGKYGIGIFGRVRAQKGVDIFVDACLKTLPSYPDYTAVVVGAISESNQNFVDELKAKIAAANMNDRIIFLGEQPFEKIPVLFRAMSLVCALSHREGFGLTPLEAMASGVTVLTSKAGAWPDIIEPEHDGVLVEKNISEEVTKNMKRLLADPKKLEDMGQAGLQKVTQKYTIEKEAEALCLHYKLLGSQQ